MSRRRRMLSYGSAGLLVVVGAACAVAFTGTAGQVLAMVLIGLGLLFAVSLVFYEVGLSEERERERSLPLRRKPKSQPRPELDRMRGQRRRLKHDDR